MNGPHGPPGTPTELREVPLTTLRNRAKRNWARSDGETFTFKPLSTHRRRPLRVRHIDVWNQSARASVWTALYLCMIIEVLHVVKVFAEQWVDTDNLDRFASAADGIDGCAKPTFRKTYPEHCANMERWHRQSYLTSILVLTLREHLVHWHQFLHALSLVGNLYQSIVGWCGHGTVCDARVHHVIDTVVGCIWWAFPLAVLISAYYLTTIISKPWREWSLARDTYRRATRHTRRDMRTDARRRADTWDLHVSSDDDTERGVIHDSTSPRVHERKRGEGQVVASHRDLERMQI